MGDHVRPNDRLFYTPELEASGFDQPFGLRVLQLYATDEILERSVWTVRIPLRNELQGLDFVDFEYAQGGPPAGTVNSGSVSEDRCFGGV